MIGGVDLSDGVWRAVVVDAHGGVLARAGQSGPTGGAAGARAVVRQAIEAAGGQLSAAGVALPCAGDPLPDAVLTAIGDVCGSPPLTIEPGAAMVLAETWCGAARDVQTAVAFSVSTHVCAGLLVNGGLWRGVHGCAGSVAWLALNPVDRQDYLRYGGLEAEVGAAGIVRRLVWRMKSGDRSRAADLVAGDLSKLTVDHVLAAARDGDGVCVSVVRETAKYVGMAVANLASILDPQAVVLGGMLPSASDLMLDAIRSECARRLPPPQRDRVPIVLSSLGADAAAIGAARAATLAVA